MCHGVGPVRGAGTPGPGRTKGKAPAANSPRRGSGGPCDPSSLDQTEIKSTVFHTHVGNAENNLPSDSQSLQGTHLGRGRGGSPGRSLSQLASVARQTRKHLGAVRLVGRAARAWCRDGGETTGFLPPHSN